MARINNSPSRRDFLRCSLLGGGALALFGRALASESTSAATAQAATAGASNCALIKGDNRTRNVLEALKAIEADVRRGLEGKKRVLIKPNFVSTTKPLAATQAAAVEGIVEFLKPVFKGEIIVGESAGFAPTEEGYKNFGYEELAKKHPVRLVNLDAEPFERMHVIDDRFVPQPIRVTRYVFDPDTYVISAAVLKTHDRVVATLSLKNLLVGSALKDLEYGRDGKRVGKTDKPVIHGNGIRGINFNLFKMAERVHPHLSVIDGFEGLEGNGPIGGTGVDHRIAIASTDWLAADRVGVEVMGIDYAKVGYLNFCAQANLGQGDLAKINVVGEKADNVKRTYRLHDNVAKQFEWG